MLHSDAPSQHREAVCDCVDCTKGSSSFDFYGAGFMEWSYPISTNPKVAMGVTSPETKLDPTADYLALSVLPNVPLEIAAEFSDGLPHSAGSFTIVGPPPVLRILQNLVDTNSVPLRGQLSSKSQVLVPTESRQSLGIPATADTYCFIHPVEHLRHHLHGLQLSKHNWASVLLMGGYTYFDSTGWPLAVNAITLAPSDTGLVLVGHELPNAQAALDVLRRSGLIHASSTPRPQPHSCSILLLRPRLRKTSIFHFLQSTSMGMPYNE